MQEANLKVNAMTVLVADDDVLLLSVYEDILEGMGYLVITASNGMEAVMLYNQYKHNISLAIFDVMMPYMTGPEAASEIASDNPLLPFIFMTGCDAHDDLKRLIIPQSFRVLPKPFDFNVFEQVVRETADR